jgi:formylglycine-generating enzyme required for sulfatase activity
MVNSIGMSLKLIPAGSFLMGSETGYGEKPVHKVTLTEPYYIGVHEVTQEQYERIMGKNLSLFKGPDNPAEQVSWADAMAFCQKLSALPSERAAGRVYRLPTEAEWEYACRAGNDTAYSFGDDAQMLGEYAWFRDNSGKTTHSVGQKKPNAWGLYDMHGNVHEWCSDWYGDYPNGAVSDPVGPREGLFLVLRGGSWIDGAADCRSAFRYWRYPSLRFDDFGFRLALSSPSGIPQ